MKLSLNFWTQNSFWSRILWWQSRKVIPPQHTLQNKFYLRVSSFEALQILLVPFNALDKSGESLSVSMIAAFVANFAVSVIL